MSIQPSLMNYLRFRKGFSQDKKIKHLSNFRTYIDTKRSRENTHIRNHVTLYISHFPHRHIILSKKKSHNYELL